MNTANKFPLFFRGINSAKNQNSTIIAADVGKANCNFGLYKVENGNLNLLEKATYSSNDYETFLEILHKFINEKNIQKPYRISLAVAGPIYEGKCITFPWMLDAEELKKQTGVDDFYMINDLESIAYSLADVDENSIEVIYKGDPHDTGNVAIMAPGIGLGESGLYSDQKFLYPFATEGGHSEFSPRTEDEVEFYRFLHKIYGIVSWENVLSKEGMFNIYRFVRDVKRQKSPEWLNEKIGKENFVKLISECGADNSERICKITLDTYIEFLAREANSLVLKLKATGGLVIAGEIPRIISTFLKKDNFYKKFIISDKMQHLLKDIPIYLLNNEEAVMLGAAYYGAFSEE